MKKKAPFLFVFILLLIPSTFGVNILRDLPSGVKVGDEIIVTLNFNPDTDKPSNVIITENIPTGWQFVAGSIVQNIGGTSIFERSRGQNGIVEFSITKVG